MFVTVGVEGAAEQGDFADEAQRRDGAGRHAAVGGQGDVRPRLARRRRPAHSRLQDGLGAAAIDVPKIVELYREGRLKLDELITGRYRVRAHQRGPRLLARRRGVAQRRRVLAAASRLYRDSGSRTPDDVHERLGGSTSVAFGVAQRIIAALRKGEVGLAKEPRFDARRGD